MDGVGHRLYAYLTNHVVGSFPANFYCIVQSSFSFQHVPQGSDETTKPHSMRRSLPGRSRLIEFYQKNLQETMQLESTEAVKIVETEWRTKNDEIDPDFLSSPAMTDDAWKQGNSNNRNIITRYSLHGFHHRLCRDESFHVASAACICRMCNEPCVLYHASECINCPSFATLAKP